MRKKYLILYSGSTWAGENPIKPDVNTLNKIFKTAKEYGGFNDLTYLTRWNKSGSFFRGNMVKLSSVFSIEIYDRNTHNLIRKKLKEIGISKR